MMKTLVKREGGRKKEPRGGKKKLLRKGEGKVPLLTFLERGGKGFRGEGPYSAGG